MKSSLAQDTTNSAKSVAQNIARQIAQEPIEILKSAADQITNPEVSKPQENGVKTPPPDNQPKTDTNAQGLKDKAFTQRRMQALQNEINDIRKQDVVKDLQGRISGGETVPLEDYPELSMEQKQVLKAQMEAYKNQALKMKNQNYSEVPAIQSKPSRRFGAGQKHEAEKQQTRVEKPVPPSG